MLVLSRLVGEKIVVGENVTIVVSRILPGRVVLGVQAPRNVLVMREELLDTKSTHPRFSNQDSEAIHPGTDISQRSPEPIDEEVFTQELVIEFDDDKVSSTETTPVASRKKSPSNSKSNRKKSSLEAPLATSPLATPERVMPRQSLREFAKALLKAPPGAKVNSNQTAYDTGIRQPNNMSSIANQQEPLLPQDEATASSYQNAQIVSEPIERCA